MKFRNVKVPEGINVSDHKPLSDLLTLTIGSAAIVVALTVALWFFGGALARYMPLRWENALAETVFSADFVPAEGADLAVEAGLQDLADRLSAQMDLPADLHVTVHYVDADTVNAAATIGGHIFIYRGLIERMPNENALAMVIGHEIGHAANRDAIAGASGLLLSQLALAVVFGGAPPGIETVLGAQNLLLLRGFSRRAERRADARALGSVAALYGHVAGAMQVFEILLAETGPEDSTLKAFVATHPLSEERIADIGATAQAQGWPVTGTTTPLARSLANLAALSEPTL